MSWDFVPALPRRPPRDKGYSTEEHCLMSQALSGQYGAFARFQIRLESGNCLFEMRANVAADARKTSGTRRVCRGGGWGWVLRVVV